MNHGEQPTWDEIAERAPALDTLLVPEWSTWIYDRSPTYKVQSLGMCKTALNAVGKTVRGGILYRLVDGKWRIITMFAPGDDQANYPLFADWDNFRNNPPYFGFVIEEHP